MDQKVHSITNTCFQHPFPPTAVPPFVLACYPLSSRIPSFVPSCPLSSICPILLSVLISSFSVIICPTKSYLVTLECSAIIQCRLMSCSALSHSLYQLLSFSFLFLLLCQLLSLQFFFILWHLQQVLSCFPLSSRVLICPPSRPCRLLWFLLIFRLLRVAIVELAISRTLAG